MSGRRRKRLPDTFGDLERAQIEMECRPTVTSKSTEPSEKAPPISFSVPSADAGVAQGAGSAYSRVILRIRADFLCTPALRGRTRSPIAWAEFVEPYYFQLFAERMGIAVEALAPLGTRREATVECAVAHAAQSQSSFAARGARAARAPATIARATTEPPLKISEINNRPVGLAFGIKLPWRSEFPLYGTKILVWPRLASRHSSYRPCCS